MKILIMMITRCVLLTGCGKEKAYETISDLSVEQEPAKMMEMVFSVPVDATKQTMEAQQNTQVYFCEDYTLTTQVLDGGDLKNSILKTTGFSPDQLSVLHVKREDVDRHSFVWTAATDAGIQVCRGILLDDGNYHYVLTAMASEDVAGALSREQWREIFNSCRLMAPEDIVSSGS